MRRRGNGKTQANQNGSVGKNAGHAETPSPAQVGRRTSLGATFPAETAKSRTWRTFRRQKHPFLTVSVGFA
jgi:hypothetical protein